MPSNAHKRRQAGIRRIEVAGLLLVAVGIVIGILGWGAGVRVVPFEIAALGIALVVLARMRARAGPRAVPTASRPARASPAKPQALQGPSLRAVARPARDHGMRPPAP